MRITLVTAMFEPMDDGRTRIPAEGEAQSARRPVPMNRLAHAASTSAMNWASRDFLTR